MRIWDVSPGYLARQQLLGEHRELHGMFSIISGNKRGYARHPETLRWAGHLPALALRHRQLVAEMQLCGYRHRSPLPDMPGAVHWPHAIENGCRARSPSPHSSIPVTPAICSRCDRRSGMR